MTRKTGLMVASVAVVLATIIGFFILLSDEARPPEPGEGPVSLRLGYRPGALGDITPVILSEFDLELENVRIETVPVPDPVTGMQRLMVGEIDAIAGIPLESIIAELKGNAFPFHAYALAMDTTGNRAVSIVGNREAGIEDIADLANRPVASLPTEQAQWLLRRILIAAGIAPEDVNVVIYNPATPLAGMEAGEHAAIFGLEPAVSRAAQEGHVILEKGPISKFLYDGEPVVAAASLITDEFYSQHPKAYQEFRDAFEKAREIAENNRAEVRELLTLRAYGELSPDVAEQVDFPVLVIPSNANREITERFVNDMIQDGIIEEYVDLSPLFQER